MGRQDNSPNPSTEGAIDRMHRRLRVHRDRFDSLLQGAERGTGTPEAFHEWHRELRRMRIDGRLWVVLTPRGRARGYEETDNQLRSLARRLGSVRNLDVSLDLLGRLAASKGRAVAAADLRVLRAALARRASAGRRALGQEVRRPPLALLREGFDRPLGASLPLAAEVRLRRSIDDAVTVGLARLEHALARVYRKPSVPRLHRLRIALRSLRAVDQTRRYVLGTPPLPVSATLRALQGDLGRLHDVDVLHENVRRLLSGERRERVLRLVARESRAQKRRLTRRLDRKIVRREWDRLLRAGPG